MDQLLSLNVNSTSLPASALGPLHLAPPPGISLPTSSAHAQQMHAHLNGLLGGMHLPHHPPLHPSATSPSAAGGPGCPPPPPPIPLPPPSHSLLPPPPLLSPTLSPSRSQTPSQNNFQVCKCERQKKYMAFHSVQCCST